MSSPSSDELFAQAARGYERARLRGALPYGLFALSLFGVALIVGRASLPTLVLGGLAAPFAVFAMWRGRAMADGVLPGLLLGAVAVLASAVAMPVMAKFGEAACSATCLGLTFVGGLAAGLLGGLANRSLSGVATTLGLALLLAPLGCVSMTVGGTVGLATGAILGLVPTYSWRQLSAGSRA